MDKYINNLLEYFQYKILAGLFASFWSDDLLILFLLFIGLEFIDIFTRWIALSKSCWKALYPQTYCSMWRAITFMWQSRKWRFIRSTGLRDGFCDKMPVYLILLLLSATVDACLSIAHAPRACLTIVVTVLATTEALSILENLSEAGVGVVDKIKKKLGDKNAECK